MRSPLRRNSVHSIVVDIVVVSDREADALAERLVIVAGPTWHRRAPVDADDLGSIGATPGQLAVVGIGGGAPRAVLAAAGCTSVAGVVLIGGRLGDDAIELIEEWPEVALLSVADPDDRCGLRSMVDSYLASAHPDSDLWVGPLDDTTLTRAADWLIERARRATAIDEVAFETDDGWILHATRSIPECDRPIPGVVLLHSGRSDRGAYARLEVLLADAGLAVLNVDWRGRGESTNLGSYFDLSSEVKAAGWRDAVAALDHLAAQPEVDATRLGAVGVVHGAEYAARAAHRDRRVRALVVLTGYQPAEPEEGSHLTSGAIDVLYVTSTDHRVTTDAMRALYDASPGRATQFVEYPGGAIGYQLFEIDPTLEPRITRWLAEVLTR